MLTNPVPLCSDAFSSWQSDDPNKLQFNEDVKNATNRLFNQVIPEFAKKLNERAIHSDLMWTYIHSYGINYRHLGKIRALVTERVINFRILTEMWVRIVKNLLNQNFRSLMQQEKLPSDVPYKKLTGLRKKKKQHNINRY